MNGFSCLYMRERERDREVGCVRSNPDERLLVVVVLVAGPRQQQQQVTRVMAAAGPLLARSPAVGVTCRCSHHRHALPTHCPLASTNILRQYCNVRRYDPIAQQYDPWVLGPSYLVPNDKQRYTYEAATKKYSLKQRRDSESKTNEVLLSPLSMGKDVAVESSTCNYRLVQ